MEHVAPPVEPVLAPVDKGSSPSKAPDAFSFSGGLAFSPSGATTLPYINFGITISKIVVSAVCLQKTQETFSYTITDVQLFFCK